MRGKRGSPAHAGIDPYVVRLFLDEDGFPRTRGDRPTGLLLHLAREKVPPHTRG